MFFDNEKACKLDVLIEQLILTHSFLFVLGPEVTCSIFVEATHQKMHLSLLLFALFNDKIKK